MDRGHSSVAACDLCLQERRLKGIGEIDRSRTFASLGALGPLSDACVAYHPATETQMAEKGVSRPEFLPRATIDGPGDTSSQIPS